MITLVSILCICFTLTVIAFLVCKTADGVAKLKYNNHNPVPTDTESVQKMLDESAEKEKIPTFDDLVRSAQRLIDEEDDNE